MSKTRKGCQLHCHEQFFSLFGPLTGMCYTLSGSLWASFGESCTNFDLILLNASLFYKRLKSSTA